MCKPGSPPRPPSASPKEAKSPGIALARPRQRNPTGERLLTPTDDLFRALAASDLNEKRAAAEAGLERFEATGDDDEELKALLLRQLYLVELEGGEIEEAYEIAVCMVDLEALGDIARQDAARAALALGRFDDALGHLRVAARVCPPSRRAFHYAHLGSLLRFSGQLESAIEAFGKAGRWATEDRTLVLAQKALAERAAGHVTDDLRALRNQLEAQVERKAYSLWILGELSVILGEERAAAQYLRQFLDRLEGAPRAKSLSLQGEIAHAQKLLAQIS